MFNHVRLCYVFQVPVFEFTPLPPSLLATAQAAVAMIQVRAADCGTRHAYQLDGLRVRCLAALQSCVGVGVGVGVGVRV
jgi:hypothetical protein